MGSTVVEKLATGYSSGGTYNKGFIIYSLRVDFLDSNSVYVFMKNFNNMASSATPTSTGFIFKTDNNLVLKWSKVFYGYTSY